MKNEDLIRVIIVDDEYLALEDLKNMIDWRENHCEIIATAQDGEEALKKIKHFKPDVVITDIRMPVMDGIELASKIREINNSIMIIFLTAFEEFDYVKKALKLNAVDYLIKYQIDKELLEKTLKSIRQTIISERDYSLKAFSNYLESVFEHKEKELQLTEMQEKLFGEYLKDHYLFVVLQESGPLPVMKHFVNNNWPVITNSEKVIEACNKHSFNGTNTLCTAQLRDRRYLILIRADGSHSQMHIIKQLNDFCKSLIISLPKFVEFDFSAFYFYTEMRISDACKCYMKYSERLYLPYIKGNMVFNIMDPSCKISQNPPQISKSEIVAAIKSCNYKQLCRSIDLASEEIVSHNNYPGLAVMAVMLIEVLKSCTEELLEDESLLQFNPNDINRWHTVKDISKWFKEKFELLILKNQEKIDKKYSKSVQLALNYIHQNYSDPDVTLDSVAIAVSLKPSRLGNIFKNETDKTIIEYLTWYRIEKAKELLDKGYFKVYEVSAKVGYSSSEYFSKVFKKAAGISPYDYKIGV